VRIDKLRLRNFKKFSELTLELHPQFSLLVGENGSGKTSILDALSVALGVWLTDVPDSTLANSRRPIYLSEKRLESVHTGDRTQFQEASGEVSVVAFGTIDGQQVGWEQSIGIGRKKASTRGAREARRIVEQAFQRAQNGDNVVLPVIAYYGAGRAWLPHRDRGEKKSTAPARRWDAFFQCLFGAIRLADLAAWFKNEAIAAVNRNGKYRPGFEIVRQAVLSCLPKADGMWYDGDRGQIVLSVDGNPQPFDNLSAGQRTMLSLVADIAVKAVTQNNFLVPEDSTSHSQPLQHVLSKTPGVVLIDELEVHLHPRWQRRVATDLKSIFPQIQFICASHSPQVIGQLSPDEIRLLDAPQVGTRPAHSIGLDSNAILEEIMGAESRSRTAQAAIDAVEQALEEGDLDVARQRLQKLKNLQHGDTGDTSRLEATINNLEALADAGD
jgi:predicted ATP-binding protein involved in virulence